MELVFSEITELVVLNFEYVFYAFCFVSYVFWSSGTMFLMLQCQEVARQVRPNSIRALFGRTKAKNAIHCTDLPEDGKLEVEYFFKVLDR